MDRMKRIADFWKDVVEQNDANLRLHFWDNALIRWHNTNEMFTVDEYIIANCEYPGKWNGTIERIEEIGDTVITVVRVHDIEEKISVHATSFIKFAQGKIIEIDEYWGDDGKVPKWRMDKNIGKQIK